ncbi:hypothetical protein PPUJ20028_51870 [Pseudomonas putida]|nr:hypothetical protein PPUJ20028_51870 [Pseudomonas putida]
MLHKNLIPNRIRNETLTEGQPLCSSNNDIELFTQYRFKATIGQQLKRQGVVTLIITSWQYH